MERQIHVHLSAIDCPEALPIAEIPIRKRSILIQGQDKTHIDVVSTGG